MLEKIISGFQDGADISGIITAKKFGLDVGGCMPKGFLTSSGLKPEYTFLYNAYEHKSNKYPPRTFENVKNSDGTIRFADDFNSAGEKCTLKAINQYNKPYIDVDKNNPIDHTLVVDWIIKNNIKILNVAGNRESTSPGIFVFTRDYLTKVLELCKQSSK